MSRGSIPKSSPRTVSTGVFRIYGAMRAAVSSISARLPVISDVCMLDILLGIWQNFNMCMQAAFQALANDLRLLILEWLKKPRDHVPPQVDGDLVKDGVCGVFIAEKLGVSH